MSRAALALFPFRTAASALIEALYPPVCIACGAETSSSQALCPSCWKEAAFIAEPVCERCGAPLETDLKPALCDACIHTPPAFDRGRAAMIYDGIGRALTLKLKHADRLDIARPAARWMARAGRDLLAEADLIAPVPLHWTRRIKRRCNQAAELARALSGLSGVAYAPDLVRRRRATASQDGRDRDARRRNMEGAFDVPRRWRARLAGRRVLLVDDVMTTGATLSAIARTLAPHGPAGVDVVILARVARASGGDIYVPGIDEDDDDEG